MLLVARMFRNGKEASFRQTFIPRRYHQTTTLLRAFGHDCHLCCIIHSCSPTEMRPGPKTITCYSKAQHQEGGKRRLLRIMGRT